MKKILAGDSAMLKCYQEKADAMKRSCLAAEDPDPAGFSGTCYYVSENGNDDHDGLTPETAICTLAKVADLPLQTGDAVLFQRGGLFRGTVVTVTGGTYSAYGVGAKPVICASRQNYADPALWMETCIPDVWRCTLPLNNVGLITFDHNPRTIGKYDALLGWLLPGHDADGYRHLEQAADLEFWCNLETQTLYLKSVGANPGERFGRMEIAENVHAFRMWGGVSQVTIDNLHITLCGGHGVSAMWDVYGLEVRNCIFDYIGGSLWRYLIRYGNAVEIFGGSHDYHVFNNWIYQIYDTGITHQCNDCKDLDVTQEYVEYHDNLIEYCFWSIEYYNQRNRFGITRNIYVHDNF
ncbi:MAG: right-handed parallel beta-helix repeat-containing protein, partial [Lentisphaeria bacterium]|nr:right-handed parallel beta-helix repeat-containing protein [Lentisphaeria bacterium]